MNNIYHYLDYRAFLKDLTANLKKEKHFNLRAFAQHAGISAPGYLKMVIDGRRNLTGDTIQKFCRALGIGGREKIYFEKLVLYNQSTDPDLKRDSWDDLLALRPRGDHDHLKLLATYLSRPHSVLIREMVRLKTFRDDPHWIARHLRPTISTREAREAVAVLLELGLLKRDRKGKLVQAEKLIHTEDRNTQETEAYHFHEAMLGLARQAMNHLRQDERHYHAFTLPLPAKAFAEIVALFSAFREQLLAKEEEGGAAADEVYQINFQLFPCTKTQGGHV